MGRKCLIKGCRTGYALSKEEKENGIDKRETLKTFSFPNKTKHLEERERWLKVIPFWKPSEIEAMTTPVICEKHWPVGFAEKKGDRGKLRPVDPPSVFEMAPISTIPTPPPKERPTKKTTFETRTRQEDQFDKFKLMDVVDYKILLEAVQIQATKATTIFRLVLSLTSAKEPKELCGFNQNLLYLASRLIRSRSSKTSLSLPSSSASDVPSRPCRKTK